MCKKCEMSEKEMLNYDKKRIYNNPDGEYFAAVNTWENEDKPTLYIQTLECEDFWCNQYEIAETEIPIKYCPFCGRKL